MDQQVYKIDFVFGKNGMMRYISHLDLMRLFTRASRRAQLPVKISEGFSPHPKISVKRALKLGLSSDAEEASMALTSRILPKDFMEKLQSQLPEGIEVKSVNYESRVG
ncbi:MAG: TIGR03936 family radical SAM-associated protein [Candidatus Omnitrophica bacterium]|jgi:radical SAM-linked protein|nr:TIGR03936 family radical SAM-associated protein [Candidatus Omnitrophota bacterium]MDD5080295.1 TIGR03936 family radical SAM-associated protein [Candidatus Omnitrophota bacterium]